MNNNSITSRVRGGGKSVNHTFDVFNMNTSVRICLHSKQNCIHPIKPLCIHVCVQVNVFVYIEYTFCIHVYKYVNIQNSLLFDLKNPVF